MAHMRLKKDQYDTLPKQLKDAIYDLQVALINWGESDHVQITFSPLKSEHLPLIDVIV